MAVFLVDFENVNSSGLSGINKLSENDSVYIFYTPNASSLSFDAHKQIIDSKAVIKYFCVSSGGKNALDFQLDSFLGYLISSSEDRDFYIVSADNGFQAVKSFWKKTMNISNAEIKLTPSIKSSVSSKAASDPKEVPDADNSNQNKASEKNAEEVENLTEAVRIKGIFSAEGISDSNVRSIIQLAKSSSDKQHFYTSMTKEFGMEEGLKIYKVLRPEYSNIRKLSKEAVKSISN